MLSEHGDAARPLAGGQSLLPSLNLRLAAPSFLLDLAGIGELRGIRVSPSGAITLGALTTHRQVERSAEIAMLLPLLSRAMRSVAHVQIRNRGTIGGSLCHADPAAEWPALCLACDARMLAAAPRGQRTIAAADFHVGLFTTALEPTELLTAVEFPAWPAARRWGFYEVAQRSGDFAMVGAAVTVDLDASHVCRSARVVVFGAGDRPERLTQVENALIGGLPVVEQVREAAAAAARAMDVRGDHHASADYRRDLIPVVIARALTQCMATGVRK